MRAFLFQNPQIRRRKNVQILSFVFFFVANLLNTFLDHLLCLQQHGEVILDMHEDDKSVSDLNVILGTETSDDCACDFEMPFVTNMTEVLETDVIVGIGALKRKNSKF